MAVMNRLKPLTPDRPIRMRDELPSPDAARDGYTIVSRIEGSEDGPYSARRGSFSPVGDRVYVGPQIDYSEER